MIVAVLISLLASAQDIRTRSIANVIPLSLAVVGLIWRFTCAPQTLLLYMGFSAALCVLMTVGEMAFRKLNRRMAIGMGDIKFITAWSIWLGLPVFFGFGAGCFLAAMFGVITKQKTIALVPWLTAGFVFTIVLCWFM
ncbi:prepilin peptidase [Atopobium fossor]|uniref:prepilin peptidase n=1 Tax=Atopobium fossor TaxID=39487 RepID=UPI000420E7FD|nr:prepilin peptidase [Atopobium fossor]